MVGKNIMAHLGTKLSNVNKSPEHAPSARGGHFFWVPPPTQALLTQLRVPAPKCLSEHVSVTKALLNET